MISEWMDLCSNIKQSPYSHSPVDTKEIQWRRSETFWCPSVSGSSTSGSESVSDSPIHDQTASCAQDFSVQTPQIITEKMFLENSYATAVPFKKIRNVRKSNKYHCVVCGDKPTGYHYDVLSCNGCKTFFRRTIIGNRKFTCTKGGTCQFTKDFRCACRSCRFDKCISVGMNRNAIQVRQDDDGVGEDVDEANSCETKPMSYSAEQQQQQQQQTKEVALSTRLMMSSSEDFSYMKALDAIIIREKAVKAFRTPHSAIVTNFPLKQILEESCMINSTVADKLCHNNELRLWQEEQYRSNPIRYWMILDLHLVVEFAKTFTSFNKCSEADRQTLLSQVGGILQIASQAFYSAEMNSESLMFPDGINALELRLKSGSKNFEHYYRNTYCKPTNMIRELKLSEREFVLFKALALFSPCSEELSEEGMELINDVRKKLITYLRKLMIYEHGLPLGTAKFGKILVALSDFIKFAEKRRNYLEVIDLMATVNLSPICKGVYLKKYDL